MSSISSLIGVHSVNGFLRDYLARKLMDPGVLTKRPEPGPAPSGCGPSFRAITEGTS